jgi:hypothetical protein
MTFALDGPELEGQASPERLGRGNHFGTWQVTGFGQLLGIQARQLRQEQKEAPAAGEEASGH